jgi:hypothetical protein
MGRERNDELASEADPAGDGDITAMAAWRLGADRFG